MPTVTILSPTEVSPNPVRLMRNDQTIMWQLGGPNLRWPQGPEPGVVFLRGGVTGEVTYADWPEGGTNPAPIQTGAAADELPYWASANHPMPADKEEHYRYAILIEQFDESAAEWRQHRVKVRRAETDSEWWDPDVVNDPRP